MERPGLYATGAVEILTVTGIGSASAFRYSVVVTIANVMSGELQKAFEDPYYEVKVEGIPLIHI